MAVAAVCLLVMVVTTLADALGRYFFGGALNGAAEVVGFLLAFTIFLALPAITRDRGHISVGMLHARFGPLGRKIGRSVEHVGTVAGLGLICWLVFDQAERARAGGDFLVNLDIVVYPLLYPLAALIAVAIIGYLRCLDCDQDGGGTDGGAP